MGLHSSFGMKQNLLSIEPKTGNLLNHNAASLCWRHCSCLPLGHDLSIDLFLFILIPVNNQNYIVIHTEVLVAMLVGIVAHDDSAIRQIAEDTAAVFSCNDTIASAADGMADLHAFKRIALYFLSRDLSSLQHRKCNSVFICVGFSIASRKSIDC